MKKTVKIAALLLFLVVIVAMLTGCGDDRLRATRTTTEFGETLTETLDARFRNNEIISARFTYEYEFENEEIAQEEYEDMIRFGEGEVRRSGRRVTLTYDLEERDLERHREDELTMTEMREALERDGFRVR